MRNDNLKGWFTENKMAIKQFAQKTLSTASNEWSENWVCPFLRDVIKGAMVNRVLFWCTSRKNPCSGIWYIFHYFPLIHKQTLFVCLFALTGLSQGSQLLHKLLGYKCLVQSLYLLTPCLIWKSVVHGLDLEHLLVRR